MEGLRSILAPEFELVGIVEDGRELVEAANRLEPDIIVADISHAAPEWTRCRRPTETSGCQAKVVFLTMHKDATYAAKALELGASGFVLKHSASTELLAAIRAALLGQSVRDERNRCRTSEIDVDANGVVVGTFTDTAATRSAATVRGRTFSTKSGRDACTFRLARPRTTKPASCTS